MSIALIARVVRPRRPISFGHPHHVPEPLDVDRVLAEQLVLQGLDGRLADEPGAAQPDARHALVRLDPDDSQAGVGVRMLAIADGLCAAASGILRS